VDFSRVCAPSCGFADFVVRTCGLLVFNSFGILGLLGSIVRCSIGSTKLIFNLLSYYIFYLWFYNMYYK
jgi:hypothetical protein